VTRRPIRFSQSVVRPSELPIGLKRIRASQLEEFLQHCSQFFLKPTAPVYRVPRLSTACRPQLGHG